MSFEMPGLKRQMEQDMQADLFWNAEVERLKDKFLTWYEKNELNRIEDNHVESTVRVD